MIAGAVVAGVQGHLDLGRVVLHVVQDKCHRCAVAAEKGEIDAVGKGRRPERQTAAARCADGEHVASVRADLPIFKAAPGLPGGNGEELFTILGIVPWKCVRHLLQCPWSCSPGRTGFNFVGKLGGFALFAYTCPFSVYALRERNPTAQKLTLGPPVRAARGARLALWGAGRSTLADVRIQNVHSQQSLGG